MSTILTDEDYARAATQLNVENCAIRAVAEVEAAGAGFIADGRPAILYEAHIFHKHTKGKHANVTDHKGKRISTQRWDRSLYGPPGAHQHLRYELARQYDADAANKSASWGTFQILGENHKAAGFDTSQDFVDAMWNGGASAHLDAFVNFLKANKLDVPLRAKNWAAFARGYNGPAYAQNKYDAKMRDAYVRCKSKGG